MQDSKSQSDSAGDDIPPTAGGDATIARRKPAPPPPSVAKDYPAEYQAIGDRRGLFNLSGGDPLTGIALAGGGIRSATFSLGILRALSARGLVHRLDYMSTVSGGGYAGAFYGGLFVGRGTNPAVVGPSSTDFLGQPGGQAALRYLRQSGRYLTPGGARDYVYAVALLFRNWMALTLVTGMAILFATLLSDGARTLVMAWCPPYRPVAWISPMALPLVPLTLAVIGCGWGYWLTMNNVARPWLRPPLIGTGLIFAGALAILFGRSAGIAADPLGIAALGIAPLAAAGLAGWGLARWLESGGTPITAQHERASREDRIRHRLTNWQGDCAAWILLVLLIAVVDSLSFAIMQVSTAYSLSLAPLIAMIVPAARWLTKRMAVTKPASSGAAGAAKSGLMARLAPLLAWLGAFILGTAALILWSGLAHWLAWHDLLSDTLHPLREGSGLWFRPIREDAALPGGWLYWALLGSGGFVLLVAATQSFVNLSSLATFYAGRLRRAYLGAGNPDRIAINGAVKPVNESDPLDDIGLIDYYKGPANGAPVHLINVTINETRGKGPATIQRDRHGLNLVISPDGLICSPTSDLQVETRPLGAAAAKGAGRNPGQSLPLSTWVGISGAAFTTGLGSRTSLAMALLAFLANVRLGYWWKADRDAAYSAPSYANLWREMTADFPGTDGSQWYLSDGGHFENTGVYELVRRKLPFIIASDNGCDPHYGFEDLANLVRKCRIDFGASIELLSSARLDKQLPDPTQRALFAAPSQFAEKDAAPGAIAMLGKITYADKSFGTLLVIKPRLTQDGPADLMRYFSDNPDFPQQTTLDQFFDEAQWESYYELGRLLTTALFTPIAGLTGWQPHKLRSIW